MLNQENFWTVDMPRPTDLPVAVELPSRADSVIIGSGYTGLNAALALAAKGCSVAVLEQKTVGWGASSRNGGMLNTGLKESIPALAKHFGAALAKDFWEWSLNAIEHVAHITTTRAIECDFHRSGQIVLAHKPSHLQAMQHEVDWHRHNLQDSQLRVLDAHELSSEIGSTSYYGGILDQRAASIHPAKYVFGLAKAAGDAGVVIVEHAEVQSITKTAAGFRCVTPVGEIIARQVALATNGYTTSLVTEARKGIFPAGSYIIVTEPLSAALQTQLSPTNRMFYDSKHFLNYFRLTPDGRMLFGGRHDLSTTVDLIQSSRDLRKRMLQVFPDLASATITHSWTGKLGLTFDLMPHLGTIASGPAAGIYYAYGYGGHGVAIASLLGKELGEIMGGERSTSLFQQIPHHRYFITQYERFFLPIVSTWFRLLDRVS
jgi:glycine/D-amino acid oxidase-like deaminating enzyme